MKVKLPKGKYIKNIIVNDDGLDVEFNKKKKVGLLLIGINQKYWPYLKQVIEDSQINFLPHHTVEYLVWTDIPEIDSPEYHAHLAPLLPQEELNRIKSQLQVQPIDQYFSREVIKESIDSIRNNKKITIYPTEGIEWPAPTLMRYHLFLQQEEKLKEYDYLFYLDADMRVVDKISDEVLGKGLTAAPHPGYVVNSRLIPPYEPNKESAAYIHRLGQVRPDEKGVNRFLPFYAAGGFQGGKTKLFLKAMHVMKKSIDSDFNKNYIAIWNDESHWNKYLWDSFKGPITFLDPSYVYPDSLIKEYYIPIWGRDYPPKIITLTKPFSLSKKAGEELSQIIGLPTEKFQCSTCQGTLEAPGFRIIRVISCPGIGKPHQLEMQKI